ncbi:MAG: hypothetical protein LC645_05335 [Geobacteraceae bacterium]|nr:hypothetical protein [Geobacteraceae bacterium]
MGQIIFVLLVVGGLGYFFYRQMSAGPAQSDSAWAQDDNSEIAAGKTQIDTDADAQNVLDAQIIDLVSRTPGILQTELYSSFPDEKRKTLQAVLLQMDRDGALQREREGSSYRLFVT